MPNVAADQVRYAHICRQPLPAFAGTIRAGAYSELTLGFVIFTQLADRAGAVAHASISPNEHRKPTGHTRPQMATMAVASGFEPW
jgi:hypothetical protein